MKQNRITQYFLVIVSLITWEFIPSPSNYLDLVTILFIKQAVIWKLIADANNKEIIFSLKTNIYNLCLIFYWHG